MDLHKNQLENEEQFIWRLGQAKDSGLLDMDWTDISAIINRECREDESEYRTEAAYRKPYQQAKRFFEAGVFPNLNDGDGTSNLAEIKFEIQKEKQKLFDERAAVRKIARDNARVEEDLSKLENLIKENGRTTLVSFDNIVNDSDNDLIISLSDFHFGIDAKNYFGVYDSDIASDRLKKYLAQILQLQKIHKSENAYLNLLGDIVSGEIHFTVQLENRESLVEQLQKSAELISAFTYELSKHFNNVYVNGVAGNHSRTSYKDQVLRGNRLDNLIHWYMKAKLSHLNNVFFTDDENYDSTIGVCSVRGNKYLLVHGDFDGFNEKGVSRLVMMLGFKPTAIFYAHYHCCAYSDILNVAIVRSGSFCGSADDLSVSRRLIGDPKQMVCVADANGIKGFYPINLK